MLPKAIQQQLDDADQMMAQLTGEAPAPEADTQHQQAPEVLEAQPEVQQVPQVASAPQPQDVDWATKYNVLQGKYNAEVPRMNQQIRELKQANDEMLAKMEELIQQRTEAQPNLVTDADKEAFGTDLVDLAERVAKQNLKPLQEQLAKLEAENAKLAQRAERTAQDVHVTAQDTYLMHLTRMVPEWEELNVDQGFLHWLGEVDPVFGMSRQAGLDRAFERLDAQATAAIFTAYLGTQAPKAKSPKDGLQNQVAPTRSRSVTAPVADEWSSKIWTGREIEHFYNEQRRGAYTLADADRISNEIDRAMAEGRVRA